MAAPPILTKKPKHVIILGAGASGSSGYPLANDLRLRMASRDSLLNSTIKALNVPISDRTKDEISDWFKIWMSPLDKALNLFREGGFATVDEFCKLAGQRFEDEVSDLKKGLRLALSTHNPEDQYEKSDYYGFVQRLFQTNLFNLRDDVVVLSFNYDVYLEFLLWRAARTRDIIRAKGIEGPRIIPDLLTSGFHSRNTKLLEESDDFCLLKLHGSIAWPNIGMWGENRDRHCFYGDLFKEHAMERIKLLTSDRVGQSNAPIVFPWEIIDERGNFIQKPTFQFRDTENGNGQRAGGYQGGTGIFELFRSIWTRARVEVLAASKISIVGLSMHEYLKPAFQFLFKEKTGFIDLVVADTYLEKFKDEGDNTAYLDPLSPIARVDQMFRELCPKLKWNIPDSERALGPSPPSMADPTVRKPIRMRKSFQEFILKEMEARFVPRGTIDFPTIVDI